MAEWMQDWKDIASVMASGAPGADVVVRATLMLNAELETVGTALSTITEAANNNQVNRQALLLTLGRAALMTERLKGRRDTEAKALRQETRDIYRAAVIAMDRRDESLSGINDLALQIMGARAMVTDTQAHIAAGRWHEAAERMRQYVATSEAWLRRQGTAN